jgi:hypothetical protein
MKTNLTLFLCSLAIFTACSRPTTALPKEGVPQNTFYWETLYECEKEANVSQDPPRALTACMQRRGMWFGE